MNYGWELPFQRLYYSNSGAGKVLLRGCVNRIASLRSGFPLNIFSGRDSFSSGRPRRAATGLCGGNLRTRTDDFATSNLREGSGARSGSLGFTSISDGQRTSRNRFPLKPALAVGG